MARTARKDETRDHQALQFLSLQKAALDLATASRYRESLAKLEEARQFAGSDEERRTVDEWVEIAKNRVGLEGVQRIDSAPTMYTFNGIGTTLYGRRNYDPHSQSYIATLYFTFIFLPIIPLASYRVKSEGGGRYHFLGKGLFESSRVYRPSYRRSGDIAIYDPGQYCGHQHITTGADCSQQFG